MDRRGFLQGAATLPLAGAALGSQGAVRGAAADLTDNLNPKIQRAREAALNILKPSKKDLEHGLTLHRESVVCDAYGFAPNSAVDGDQLLAAIDAGASSAELRELEEEMHMTRHVGDPAARAEYAEAWRASGVTCILQNAGYTQSVKRYIRRLARFTYVADMVPECLRRAATPDDIVKAKQEGKHCLYMSGNAVPLAEEWSSVEEELVFVRVLFQLGMRMMHLTYNRRNMIGDGCGERFDGGLSDFGRAAVAELNRVGVIVDVAHSGWRTSLEAAKASRVPMVASHTSACGVNNHIRAKPDHVIKAIADTGGLVGVCWIGGFLGRTGDLNAMLDHVDYIAKLIGPEHVAIGTDVAYSARHAPEEAKKLAGKRRKSRTAWHQLWPPNTYGLSENYPEPNQLSLEWTNWPLATVGLVQRGYSDEDIRKIIGQNVVRVAREALAAGKPL